MPLPAISWIAITGDNLKIRIPSIFIHERLLASLNRCWQITSHYFYAISGGWAEPTDAEYDGKEQHDYCEP